MRIRLRCIGKPRDRALASAIAEYEKRVRRYWTFDAVEVREERATSLAPKLVREREGERLLADVDPGAHVVACDASGWTPTSEEIADWLRQERERPTRDLTFVIGGSFGLDEAVIRRARTRLSFSRWTLPHELARLVLTEQLYRSGTILRGEPYHK